MSRPIGNLTACEKPTVAWVILRRGKNKNGTPGTWEGFRTIMAYRQIKRGRHKGLYRVRLTNGMNAWARDIQAGVHFPKEEP